MVGDPYETMKKWTATVPNDGLIRYYIASNVERVAVVGTKALSEVLVQKAYDFEKPEMIRAALARVTGVGILLAEGEEHKVGSSSSRSSVGSG